MSNGRQIEDNIYEDGFYVDFEGDPSVGIPHATWTIEGGFHFEYQEDVNDFMDLIKQVFGYVADESCIGVMPFSEYNAIIEAEDKMING